jgi:PAS domain S-box-containing protein
MRTLIYEMDTEARSVLETVLQGTSHQSAAVDTVSRLELSIESGAFDTYIIDLDPDTNGALDLIARSTAADPSLSVMVTSTTNEQQPAVRALEAGARLFLQKPIVEQEARLKIGKLESVRSASIRSRHLLGDLILDRSDLRLKVAERERFLTHLIDAAPVAVYSTDKEGKIISFNRAAEALYGYDAREIVGQRASILYPKGKDEVEPGHLSRHLGMDNQPLSVVVARRQIQNEAGQHVADLHIVEDVADKVQAESQLLRADRLSTLGQLVPQVAHEFKSPIQVITSAVDLARSKLNGTYPDVDDWLERVLNAALEMNGLVLRMIDLGKPSEAQSGEVHLGMVTTEVVRAIEPLGLSKYTDLSLDIRSTVPIFEGDPVEISQVVRNLIINAMHALDKTSSDRLAVRVFEKSGCAVLEVEDQGIGIPEEQLRQVFEPYYTTKEESGGTGLGLSVVKKIVDRHGGEVAVRSEVGVGTTFTLSFPT